MTHLVNHCVTMIELIDEFYENTEMSDVICENGSKINGKNNKAKFLKHHSVLNLSMQLRIFLQR